jgi:hypothetical protein
MAEAMRVEFADVEADARQEYESVREEVGVSGVSRLQQQLPHCSCCTVGRTVTTP